MRHCQWSRATHQLIMQQSLQTALHYHQSGQLAQAEALYRHLLRIQPDQPRVLHLLGLLAYQQGNFELAAQEIGRAIKLSPDESDYHNNLAIALRASGCLDQAIEAYRRALQLTPQDSDIHRNLANALYEAGHHDEAAVSYHAALDIWPGDVAALCGLAGVMSERGDSDNAEQCYRHALRLEPNEADAHYGLANLLREGGRSEEAIMAYRTLLQLQPEYPCAARHLGWLLQEAGQTEDAVAAYHVAIRSDPSDGVAHYNLGNALSTLGNFEAAVASYLAALKIDPADADTHNNLGNALRELGRLDEAIACYRRALELNPQLHHACAHLLHQCQHACDWSDIGMLAKKVLADVDTSHDASIAPFVLLALPGATATQQLRCAQNWAANQYQGLKPRYSHHPAKKSKIRIGYLSADFHEHATAYLMAEVFELHDAGRFEITAYSYGPDDRSPMRARLEQAFHRFEDITSLSMEQAAGKIYADEIDLLVDLKGYTAHTRTQILALRPAPVQVNFLGYPGTLGAEFVDYLIGDPVVTPLEHAPFYSEHLALLPNTYQPNDRKRPQTKPPSRKECGLPEQGVVFCGFNQAFKILPESFDVWMRLLRETPDSVLWLLQPHPLAEANLKREAQARGVDAGRLVFAPRLPLAQHLARQPLADLLLDTLPYNAHTTASDALWCGVPVVTCIGETFASRVAASLLHAAGLGELVTHTMDEYATLALHLAGEPEARQQLRERLLVARTQAPLFDAQRYTRDLEGLYEKMWERFLHGEPPAMIHM